MAHSMKKKGMPADLKELKEPVVSTTPTTNYNINAPKYGTIIPNRVFVGGISSSTTEDDLAQLFSNYGTVINSKIIVDRAGISKGYGFVTFETDDEAKRIQNDADNIVLKERKLNIAPAIKKQAQSVDIRKRVSKNNLILYVLKGYGRSTYDSIQAGSPPVPNQIFRQANGITYTFHNGMAYFPNQAVPPQAAQPLTPLPGSHLEHSSPIYSPAGTYSSLPHSNSGHFPYGYAAPQGHLYYHHAHYPYPIQQFDGGCYPIGDTPNGVVALQSGNENGSLIPYHQCYLPQHQSQPELAYYQPQALTQEPYSIYPSPRGYDSATVFYSEQNIESPSKIATPPPKTNLPPLSTNNLPPSSKKNLPPPKTAPPPPPKTTPPPPQQAKMRLEPSKPQPQPSKPRTKPKRETKMVSNKVETTPVVSLSKVYHNKNEGRTKFIPFKKKLPQQSFLNNNCPTVTNRNTGTKTKPSTVNVNSVQHQSYRPHQPNQPHQPHQPRDHHNHNISSSMQVPQFQFLSTRPYHNQVGPSPNYYSPVPRRAYYHRNKYSPRSKMNTATKWYNKDIGQNTGDDGMAHPLTPPITPRSHDIDSSGTQTDEVVQSTQKLSI